MSSSPLLPAPHRNNWNDSEQSTVTMLRQQLRRSLDSKAAHYSILLLVSLDVACLFADLIIQLHVCGRHHTKPFKNALTGLSIAGLVFSCLFMFELMASVWAFGLSYFTSKFHIFDAIIIITSFIVEVTLRGITEEAASLIIILRLFRVAKIIDELGVAADEQMKQVEARLVQLENDNQELRQEVERLRGYH